MTESGQQRVAQSRFGTTGRSPSGGPAHRRRSLGLLALAVALPACSGFLGPDDDESRASATEEIQRPSPSGRNDEAVPATPLDEEFAFLRAENVERIPLAMVQPERPGPEPPPDRLRRRSPRKAPSPKEDPPILDEARRTVEEARSAGAEHLGAYREAAAALRLAEALHRRGATRAQVVATARRAVDAARQAREQLRTPPEPSRPARDLPTPTATPRLRTARIRPTPGPSRPTPRPTTAAAPAPPEPTRRGADATPEPTPTPDPASRRVLVLRSSDEIRVYRAVTDALVRDLPGRVAVQDLGSNRLDALDVEGGPADLVVAVGSAAATLAQREVTDRPVIFCAALNPERHDLSASNVGGVSFELSAADQLHRIRKALPSVQRVGVIHNPQVSGAFVEQAQRAADDLGLRLVAAVAWEPRDVGFVFRSLRKHIDLLWIIPDPAVLSRESFEVLRVQTAEAGIPFVSYAEMFARKGALLALYPEPENVGRQCAKLATQVLTGEVSPADVGIRSPEKYRVAVNRRTQERLGITVDSGLRPDLEIR